MRLAGRISRMSLFMELNVADLVPQLPVDDLPIFHVHDNVIRSPAEVLADCHPIICDCSDLHKGFSCCLRNFGRQSALQQR
jgi:hypothetical protein